jgi:hypothetical protein
VDLSLARKVAREKNQRWRVGALAKKVLCVKEEGIKWSTACVKEEKKRGKVLRGSLLLLIFLSLSVWGVEDAAGQKKDAEVEIAQTYNEIRDEGPEEE